ncbi:MAG: tRNA (adenosine(37)-N6)-threonylcarbamoyltransferase complex dimerization subunit type 1 TsaB, partial [Bacteroidales bacterium]|nr:tRNA (adenosine(37)-N6)-threonylcarbamoyltransferase complex dimerization subunit type 1 TsaB [Bacteroidales bacterium]
SMGPGSFTGLRIGLTTAKGLGYGANLPIVPIPTFNALALQISDFVPAKNNFVIIKNASVDDLYYASLYYDGKKIGFSSELSIIKKNDIDSILKKDELIFSDIDFEFATKKIIGPSALNICRYSYLFGKDLLTFDYDYLEPFYLKQFLVRVKK